LRSIHTFNTQWLFNPKQVDTDTPDSQFTSVILPHSNVILPYHNFDDAEYQFISTYRQRFHLPEPLNGRRLFIDFEGALTATTFSINGVTFQEFRGGFTPFSFDITDAVNESGENLINIHLDSRERKDIPPFGHTVDYMVFGGIYREVQLRYVYPVHISNVQVKSHGILHGQPQVEIAVHVTNLTDHPQGVAIGASMEYWRTEFAEGTVEPNSTLILQAYSDLIDYPNLQKWTLDNPKLYNFDVTLYESATLNSVNEVIYDTQKVRSGLREAWFTQEGFYLNGERIKLRGLNRHQNYPYIGAAAPARLQRKDADILKYDLGLNIARTSHYPQSRHFLDRCDEIGLLVFEEIPGWQYIGDEDWQCLAIENVQAMITRDWNHPSIIIWGIRINESWDNTDFYTETNRVARELDPTRPTGGVRFFIESEFLEDVFTLNDFSNGIMQPHPRPHLVTEFNGHMYPTKTWDNEERRVEHARRHAKVQSLAQGTEGVSGAIGWCAFDYNTHVEFGAGDRICYHGVMDIFRLPKFAAYFYASQQSPSQRVVLQAATQWKLGDVKEGLIEPITVFSNCDTIEAYLGDEKKGTFKPDSAQYNLTHPPFTLTDLGAILAHPYGDLKLVGYINGEKVAEQIIASDSMPKQVLLKADDSELHADGSDMTRVSFFVADKYGNTLPYALSVVYLSIEGDGDLIGQNPFPLVGGQGAVYVKAGTKTSTLTITAKVDRLPEARVNIQVS
jgi:beta-galactosidase